MMSLINLTVFMFNFKTIHDFLMINIKDVFKTPLAKAIYFQTDRNI